MVKKNALTAVLARELGQANALADPQGQMGPPKYKILFSSLNPLFSLATQSPQHKLPCTAKQSYSVCVALSTSELMVPPTL